MRLLLGVVLLFCAVAPAMAVDDPSPAQSYVAVDAISGVEIKLSNGNILRLQDIEPPFVGTSDWRDKARAFLKQMVSDHEVFVDEQSADRYGRLSGQGYIVDAKGQKIWLQKELLHQGLGFVFAPAGNSKIDELRATELAVRKSGTGIWGDAAYADVGVDKADDRYGHFAFVSGIVVDAERMKNAVYLNFGEDWRTDFTASIAAHDLRAFRDLNIDPLTFKGKRIRVRGWVKRDFGPMIAVSDPSQIDLPNTN